VKIFETADIRNIALAGHSGSGKTTLGESMILAAGAVTRQGRVADGTTVTDFTPEEQKRHTGVYLSLAQFEFQGKKFNLLDCPGYADFIGEVHSGLSAADCGVIVVSATSGVEPDTERVFSMMDERSMPRFLVVNAMDKEQADYPKVLQQIREVLSDRVAPLFFPIGQGPDFRGIVDVMAGKAWMFGTGKEVTQAPVPAELQGPVEEARGKLVELAAESDDAYLEKYLETLELSPEETRTGLRKGIAQGRIYPVMPASAERSRGGLHLLQLLSELAPNPAEVLGPLVTRPGKAETHRLIADPAGPLAAHIFKISSEFMAQEVALLRVYSGTLVSGSEVYDSRNDTAERIGQLYHFMGRERSDAEKLVAGDIGAAAKLKSAGLNDTLTTKDQKIVVAPIDFPRPVHEMGVRSRNKGDEEKVGTAFSKLRDEDPTFQIEVQSDLHQTVLRTMGDQHVDVIVERLRRKFGVEVETYKPRIPYRETIKGTSDVSYRHKKQTGGRGQFADVSIKIEPLPRGSGFEFLDEIVGGVIPSKFIPAVEKGIVEGLSEGGLAGYPVVDFRVRLHFGGYHDVDSSEMAFKIAGLNAFRNGMREAKPVLLEPIMQVQIEVPEDYTGGVMGDLSSRRGKILGMEPGPRTQRIKAAVPQGELYRYSTTLRTLTQGRARYQTEFSHYEEVPREIAEKLIEELKKEREAAA
jgi:elongation factor G